MDIRPLWLSSSVRRPWGAAALVLVSLLATAGAVAGPVLSRAVEQSALAVAVANASVDGADVIVGDQTSRSRPLNVAAADSMSAAAQATSSGLFGPPVLAVESTGGVSWHAASGSPSGVVRIVARGDGCAAFLLTQGRCAAGTGEVVVPADALAASVRLGDRLAIGVPTGPQPQGYTVVGAYDATRSKAIQSTDLNLLASSQIVTGAPLVLALPGLQQQNVNFSVAARAQVDPARLRLDTENEARAAVTAAHTSAVLRGASLTFLSQVPDLLDEVDKQRQSAAALIALITVQLVALAVLAAVVVMQAMARSRTREWALGRFRGLSRRSWVWSVFAEPAVLLVVGVAAGCSVGVGLAAAVAGRFPAGVGLEPVRLPVLVAAGASVVALAAALIFACLRPARASLAVVLRDEAEPTPRFRASLVAVVLLIAISAEGVYQLVVGTTLTGPVSVLALAVPGLLATTAGLVAVRGLGWWARRSTGRPAKTVSGLLVWRRLARSPGSLLPGVAVAVAVALVVFATQLLAQSQRNLTLRADAVAAAAVVQRVNLPKGVDLLQLVRTADPSGRQAMAAAEIVGASGTGRVVAVDIDRMAAVSTWNAGWAGTTAFDLEHELRPDRPAPLVLRGTQVRLTIDHIELDPSGGDNSAANDASGLHLVMTVDDGAAWHKVDFDPLPDSGPVTMSAALPCPQGCRLVRIGTASSRQSYTSYSVSVTVTGMSTDQQPAGEFAGQLRTARWRPVSTSSAEGGEASASAGESAAGLRLEMMDIEGYLEPAVAPGDVVDPLPAVVGRRSALSFYPGLADIAYGTGFDQQAQLLRIVRTTSVLPRALDDGVLVDLADALQLSDPAGRSVQWEVWRVPGSLPDLDRALAAAHVTVTGTDTLAEQVQVEAAAATALAPVVGVDLLGIAGALVLALLAASRLIDRPGRRRVWQAVRWAGVSRRRMVLLTGLEIAVPALVGVLVGAAAALVALVIAGDRLPLFAAGTVTPPLDTSPRWAWLAAAVVGALVAVLLVAGSLAATEARGNRTRP